MTRRARRSVLLALLAALPSASWGQAHEHPRPVVLAPGYAELAFEAPVPGSYALPPLGAAAEATLLDVSGRRASLHELFDDRFVVLSFIYTRCGDVNGCPLATYVLGQLQQKLMAERDLAGKLRMISVSFDPEHDQPAVMSAYAARFKPPGADWHFLTAPSSAQLAPLLEAYDQWVISDLDEDGNHLGTLSHLLRVYLIDRERQIRNIYSVSFLHADTIAADVRTLLLEDAEEPFEG